MGKVILFSPVGGTDPMSASNCQDGSMLHIARVYKPTDVIMYMSKEILEKHKKDNRYVYALDKLADLQGRKMNCRIIERPELENVQEYDFFYNEFLDVIQDIKNDMDETDKLILNVASGTPAMKSGLLILQQLMDMDFISVQVRTPERGMNIHKNDNYVVEEIWELNPDNQFDFENRCIEVKCASLLQIKNEEVIKKHVKAYNYTAALELAKTMPERSKNYINLLEIAEKRSLYDIDAVEKILKREKSKRLWDCMLPINDKVKSKYFEYALNIDLKRKKKEYVDFIRSITPLVVDLFERIIEVQTDIKINDYCRYTKKKRRIWDKEKLMSDKIGIRINDRLKRKLGNDFRYGDVYSSQLKEIIEEFCNNQKLMDTVTNLREVEVKIRNIAAHEMISVDEEIIRIETGLNSEGIMKQIKIAFNYADMKAENGIWGSYERMNKLIIEHM